MTTFDPEIPPASQGYLFPAEWEHHEATWLSWPNCRGATFPGDLLTGVLPAFLELVNALSAAGETVAINVSDQFERETIESGISSQALQAVRFETIATNEPWCRDHGPTVLKHRGNDSRVAVCWNYNSWGGKYPPWDLDAAAGPKMAESFGIDVCPRRDLTIEGGSLESDGAGLLMVSESSVVCPSRNPGLSRDQLERELMDATGAGEILWVNGEVPGDDTDGHVDCFARFAPYSVILGLDPTEKQERDFPSLAKNAKRLRTWARERDWRFAGLPIPEPIISEEMVLPATYANFYIANESVILPAFDDALDAEAAAIVGDAFPGKSVVPFPARHLIVGQGGIHCLTQQLPG